jgi:Ser-tRNA(Ala) deacylase AlaX
MTRKLFWDDPYRTEIDTRVNGVTGAEITLAETIFYAESGGQESDAGTLADGQYSTPAKTAWTSSTCGLNGITLK